MCGSVRKIGGIGSTASLGGRDRENLLSAHDTYRPHVHWMCIRREWTTHGHAHRPSCGALRALSFNESNTRSRITCSLSLVDVRREDLGRQRAEKVPIVAGPEMGDPGVDGASPGRSPQRAPRSHALEKEDCKAVLAQRLAHGSPPRRA